jgi:hypothetical protein
MVFNFYFNRIVNSGGYLTRPHQSELSRLNLNVQKLIHSFFIKDQMKGLDKLMQ